MVIISGFQPDDVGSIPSTRSFKFYILFNVRQYGALDISETQVGKEVTHHIQKT